MSIQGHFIQSVLGRVFVTQFGDQKSDTAVLCLPSVVEELNLARAVLAKQCQAFSRQGVDSFIMDYFGTGDSEGEFEQASADDWLNDVITVGQWLVAQGYQKLIIIGVRVGALLLAANQALLHQQLPIVGQILWKPITSGKLFVSQLLRIKQANQMMANTSEKVNWRNEILAGNSTEIAGYLVTRTFIEQLETLAIEPKSPWLSQTHWLELAATDLTPATKRFTNGQSSIQTHTLATPAFWQVPEVFDLPELTTLGKQILAELETN